MDQLGGAEAAGAGGAHTQGVGTADGINVEKRNRNARTAAVKHTNTEVRRLDVKMIHFV